jgi:hypothetical protein
MRLLSRSRSPQTPYPELHFARQGVGATQTGAVPVADPALSAVTPGEGRVKASRRQAAPQVIDRQFLPPLEKSQRTFCA